MAFLSTSRANGPPRCLPDPVLALKAQTPHWASIMARNRGTGPPQVLAAQGAHGCSRSLGPSRLQQTGCTEWQEARVIYTRVPKRLAAHHGTAEQAQEFEDVNVEPPLPKNHFERYRGRLNARGYGRCPRGFASGLLLAAFSNCTSKTRRTNSVWLEMLSRR